MSILSKITQPILKPFGYSLTKITSPQQAVSCPKFPLPSEEITRKALDNFSNEFDICPQCTMGPGEIRQKVSSFFWHYPFGIGPDINIQGDAPLGKGLRGRHFQRYKHFFPPLLSLTGGSLEGKTILDWGCNCGFWSIQAIRNGARNVLGFDGSGKNVEQANFLRDIIGLKNVEYRTLDIFQVDKSTLGQFDISFFLGLLYHLNKPIEALARLKDVTAGIAVIDSSWTVSNQPIMVLHSDNVHDQNFSNALCMRPSCSAVYLMLKHVGFKNVRLLEHATDDLPEIYLEGGRGTFIAEV
jgi:hypothetical protein